MPAVVADQRAAEAVLVAANADIGVARAALLPNLSLSASAAASGLITAGGASSAALGASLAQPVRQLVGFQRVALAPGESREVEFTLGFEQLSFINARSERVVEPGTRYDFWVGDSAEATQQASLTLE